MCTTEYTLFTERFSSSLIQWKEHLMIIIPLFYFYQKLYFLLFRNDILQKNQEKICQSNSVGTSLGETISLNLSSGKKINQVFL